MFSLTNSLLLRLKELRVIKYVRFLIIPVLLICLFAGSGYGHAEQTSVVQPPSLQSEAAILIDARSGTVLYEKNAGERMYPASITKIVTGIMALESGKLDDLVTVSKEARNEDGTRVYLAEGEQVSLEKLVYALLLNSGNDAATAIAEHLAGSKALFAESMNAFVRDKVGVTDTHFTNPHGLPDAEHYTTASDMARIAQYAMRNDKFREVVVTQKMPWNGKEWQSQLENHNKLLTNYEGAIGVKNGFTQAAGYTLIGAASRDGFELIGVILKASTNKSLYAEMTKLLDYGFAAYEPRLLFTAEEPYTLSLPNEDAIQFVANEEIWTAVPKHEAVAPSIDRTGAITMIGANRSWPAGSLSLVEPVVPLDTASKERTQSLADSAEGILQPQQSSVWSIPIAAAWMLMIVMLGAAAVGIRSRQKKA